MIQAIGILLLIIHLILFGWYKGWIEDPFKKKRIENQYDKKEYSLTATIGMTAYNYQDINCNESLANVNSLYYAPDGSLVCYQPYFWGDYP